MAGTYYLPLQEQLEVTFTGITSDVNQAHVRLHPTGILPVYMVPYSVIYQVI